jgi:hypothetical protein
MTEHIFRTQNPDTQSMFYCLSGQEDFIDKENNPRVTEEQDNRVTAKAVQNKKPKHFKDTSNQYRYYIKINPNLEIYNPINLHSSIKDKKKFSHINTVCKNDWAFKEVDKSVFDKYVAFLTHQNAQSLKDLERQIK